MVLGPAALLSCALALLICAEAGAKPLSLLSAERGEQARIVDERGREVLLRGVNVNQLGDYYAANEHPPSAPLRRSDFRRISRLGFNQVRLVTNWSRWEPQPGSYDVEYLREVKRAVRWARKEGLYTLLDMHQDAWGKFTAAAPGEVCPPGFEPNIGWDGAPEWATFTDGLPACNVGETREISPAVAQAWQNFYSDREGPGGVGIQTRLVDLWGWIAERFRGEDSIAGYDLINEPHPGLVIAGAEASTIVPFYRRAIAEIRASDSRHTIYVEPTVVRSGFPELITMPFVSDDPNLVYAPHIYGDRNSSGIANEQAEWIDGVFAEAREAGGDAGALPVLIGEFGALDPPAREAYTEEFMALAEKYRVGWSHWVWKDTCGDPHTGYGPFPDETMNIYDCEADRFTEIKRTRVLALSRPYPQATVGRLRSLGFDPQTRRFAFEAERGGRERGRTVVMIPARRHYGSGAEAVTVETDNVRHLRLDRVQGGNLRLSFAPGRGEYSIEVAPG